MRIKIVQKPALSCIDGVRFYIFEGFQHEVGNVIGKPTRRTSMDRPQVRSIDVVARAFVRPDE